MVASLRALLSGIVDYAGLYPPAGLPLKRVCENYAGYLASPERWMLGRLVVPVERLEEMAALVPVDTETWKVTAVCGEDPAGALREIAAFNASGSRALVDMAEVRAGSREAVHAIAALQPPGVRAFVEIASAEDPRPLLYVLAEHRLRAKIRTGGVVPDAIPAVGDVARFIRSCYATGVGFKATAGLHHPLCADYALTYENGSVRASMHGFLNVFLTALFCYNGIGQIDAPELLSLSDASELTFDDRGVAWREYRVSVSEIETIRRRFAISFGSCSFTEPVDDLRALKLL